MNKKEIMGKYKDEIQQASTLTNDLCKLLQKFTEPVIRESIVFATIQLLIHQIDDGRRITSMVGLLEVIKSRLLERPEINNGGDLDALLKILDNLQVCDCGPDLDPRRN